MGVLWSRPVSFIFVRHSRYTFQFTERENAYSLCFFDESHRPALTKLGTLSGRDGDKLAGTGDVYKRQALARAMASSTSLRTVMSRPVPTSPSNCPRSS